MKATALEKLSADTETNESTELYGHGDKARKHLYPRLYYRVLFFQSSSGQIPFEDDLAHNKFSVLIASMKGGGVHGCLATWTSHAGG